MGDTILITVAGKHYIPTTKCVLKYFPRKIIALVSNDVNGTEDFGKYAQKSIQAMKRVAKDVGMNLEKIEQEDITGLDFNQFVDKIRAIVAKNSGPTDDRNHIVFNMMNGTPLAAAALAVAHSYCKAELVHIPDPDKPIDVAFSNLDILDIDGFDEDNDVRRLILRQLYIYETYVRSRGGDKFALGTKAMFGKGVEGVSKSNFYQHIDVLVERKLIASDNDSKYRKVSVSLTEKGRIVAKNLKFSKVVYNTAFPELNDFASKYAETESSIVDNIPVDEDGPVYIVLVGKHIDHACEVYVKGGIEMQPSRIYYIVSADLDDPEDEYTRYHREISARLGPGIVKQVDYTDIYSVYNAFEEILRETGAVKRLAIGRETAGGEFGAILRRPVIVNICNGTKAMVVGASTYAFANGCIIAYPSFGKEVREIKFYETIDNYDVVRMRMKDKYVLKFIESHPRCSNHQIVESCRLFKLSDSSVCQILKDLRRGNEYRENYEPLIQSDSNVLTEKGATMASLIYDFTDRDLEQYVKPVKPERKPAD